MYTKRIIPCLDVNNGRVVKGVNFVDLKDAGDPVSVGAAYGKAGADELVFYCGLCCWRQGPLYSASKSHIFYSNEPKNCNQQPVFLWFFYPYALYWGVLLGYLLICIVLMQTLKKGVRRS